MEQQRIVKDVEPEYEYEDDSISDGEESIVLTSQKTGIRHGQGDGKALANKSRNLFLHEDARGPTLVSPDEEQLQDLNSPNRLEDELDVSKVSENSICKKELAVEERELNKRVQKRKHLIDECKASKNSKKPRSRSSVQKNQTDDPIRFLRDRFFPEEILILHGLRFKKRCELELEDESEYPKLIEALRAEKLVDCAVHGTCETETSEKVISKKVPSEYSVASDEDQHGNGIGNATHTEGNAKADRDETFESDKDTFCTVGKTSSISGNKPDLIDNKESEILSASKLSASIVADKKVNANLDNGGQSSRQRYIKSTDFLDVSEAQDEDKDLLILILCIKNQDEGCHTDTPPPSFCHPEINYNTQERGTMENDALNSKSDESEHIAESLLPNLSPIVEGFQPNYKTDNRNSSQTKEVKEKLKIKLQAKNSSVEVSHPVMIENIKTEISDSSFNIVQEDNPLYGGDDPDKGTQKMIQQENKLLPKTFNVVNIKSASFDKQSPLKPYQRRLLADTVNNALNQIDSTSDESEHMAETPNISHIVQGFQPNYPTDQRNSPKTETPCGEEVKRQLKKMLQAKNPSVELSQTVMIENIKTEILDGPFNIVQDNEEATLLYGYGGPGGMIVNDNTN